MTIYQPYCISLCCSPCIPFTNLVKNRIMKYHWTTWTLYWNNIINVRSKVGKWEWILNSPYTCKIEIDFSRILINTGGDKCPQEGNTPGGMVVQAPGGSITGVQEELEFMTYSDRDRCWVSFVCLSNQYLGCPTKGSTSTSSRWLWVWQWAINWVPMPGMQVSYYAFQDFRVLEPGRLWN